MQSSGSGSFFYYTPAPLSAKDMELMRKIDEIHLVTPFYGRRKIRNELWARVYDVGRDDLE
jgi:putative transposase